MSQIEANSLSLGQVRDVINGRLVLGEQKEIQEVKNAYAAYESLSEINPYSIKDLKKFHGIMTKYLVEECGEFLMEMNAFLWHLRRNLYRSLWMNRLNG